MRFGSLDPRLAREDYCNTNRSPDRALSQISSTWRVRITSFDDNYTVGCCSFRMSMLIPDGTHPVPPWVNGRIRPQRTEVLQRLYDRWRDSVECQTFESFLQLNQDRAMLQVPSLQRSLAQRSGGSSSSTRLASSAPEDYEFGEHDKKPQRRGPLSKTKREKTAFIRRLGACVSCRGRKVAVGHSAVHWPGILD